MAERASSRYVDELKKLLQMAERAFFTCVDELKKLLHGGKSILHMCG
jgi:hypothetical protein